MRTLLTLLLFCAPLSAGIEEYFKKATEKKPQKGIEKIDYVYVINLDKRPEKFEGCLCQLAPYGIDAYRFSAVNGWELTLDGINRLGVVFTPGMLPGIWGTYYALNGDGKPEHEVMQHYGKTYYSHCMSRGAIGICLSHLSVLQDAYDSGYKVIWVMEDDIDVLRNPHLLATKIEELDGAVEREGWDVLFTDQDTKNNDGHYVPCFAYAQRPDYTSSNVTGYSLRKYITYDLRQIGARYGAYSMIVNRSGMKKILDFFRTYGIFLPYDIDFNQIPSIRMFTVINDIVSTQIDAPSDNGAPRYTESGSKISLWQGASLNLNQAKLAPKQANLNRLVDAGGFKVRGKSTQPETDF